MQQFRIISNNTDTSGRPPAALAHNTISIIDRLLRMVAGGVQSILQLSPHILRLLREQKADSKQTAVKRKWLDDQLIGKVE